ncbi:MAG TPA: hypothetical protein P5231_11030 [Ignavibacteriales bacterium]|nr:hypothetical protein [Ignavibacteriales bacterium]
MNKNKQYWYCLIGGVPKRKLDKYYGADSILRHPVRNAFNEVFGPDEVCVSGWGIDEERYNLLMLIESKSTEDLKNLLDIK